MRSRVFGIGLNKTATTSLHDALTILGYECLHGGLTGGPEIRARVFEALETGEPLLTNLDPCFDAFMDIGSLAKRFELLDEQYPGSAFILTVRPVNDWIDSRRRHVERNRRAHAAGRYHGTFLDIDVDRWRRSWARHLARARSYFAGRNDFLEIDLTASPEWGPLCDLLGIDRPEEPFPWANRHG